MAAATLRLSGVTEVAELAGYLRRLLRYDRGAAARLQGVGDALAVYGQPPFGVVAMRSFAVAAAADDEIDVTVSVAELLAGMTRQSIAVPSALAAVAWAGLLPPRDGWQRRAEAPATVVVQAVLEGVAAFRNRTAALAGPGRSREALEAVAADVWARPVLAGIPLRAAHAAYALGLLEPAENVCVDMAGSWLRLVGTHGLVAVRRSDRPALRLA